MKFKPIDIKATSFNGALRYVWFEDKAAGLPNVYSVLVLSSSDPVQIGRELRLRFVRKLIERMEKAANKLFDKGTWFYGDRTFVLTVRNMVMASAKKKAS